MKYSDLLLSSARQALTNKISWLYVFAALIGQFTSTSSPLAESIPTIKSSSSGFWFLSTLLSTVFTAGLAYSVSQKEQYNIDISIADAWRKGWSKIFHVGLLTILLLIILLFVLFFSGIVLKISISFGILRTLIMALLIRPILNFGICALVISSLSIVSAVKLSVAIFMKNSFQTLAVSGLLIIIQQVLLSIIILLFMNNYSETLLGSPFKLFDIPQIMFWDQVLSLVLSPWIVIVFTHLFLQFKNASEMATLPSGQEAA